MGYKEELYKEVESMKALITAVPYNCGISRVHYEASVVMLRELQKDFMHRIGEVNALAAAL